MLLLLLAAARPLSAIAAVPPDGDASDRTLTRSIDPVTIEGYLLPDALGTDISRLRLFAFGHGVAARIPFQIDQRDATDNWVWDVAYSHKGAPAYREDWGYPAWDTTVHTAAVTDNEDPPGRAVLDENDVLVFMARDVGDRNPDAAARLQGARLQEIRVSDPVDGSSGWVYLAAFVSEPPLPSRPRYMRYLTEQRRVASPLYEFTYSDEHVALIRDLAIKGVPMLDRINVNGRIDVRLGIVGKTIRFNEEDIHGHVEGYIAGPVRIVKRSVAFLDLGMGLCSPEVKCDHFYYPEYAQVPTCLAMRFPVKQCTMQLSVDYTGSPFKRIFIGGERGVKRVVGLDSDTVVPGDLERAEWMALDGANGSVISFLTLPARIGNFVQAVPYLAGDEVETVLDEQEPVKAGHEAGFKIKALPGCPRGHHVVYGYYVISGRPYRLGDEQKALDLVRHRLTFSVKTL
jgi:hypothetical protein